MGNNILNKMDKYLSNQAFRIRVNSKLGFYNNMDDKKYIEKLFKASMEYPLDLYNPKTFNEKLQWLKLYNRKPEYTTMVDKYKVRDYIAEKIGEEYLIPIIGAWDDPNDIYFDSLPNQFVLKCNHNSGLGMCICKDKSKLDINNVKKELQKGLEQDYYLTGREWPYKNVPKKIICEKYMQQETGEDLIDYKFYCFDGQVKLVGIYSGRNSKAGTVVDYFEKKFNWVDINWGYDHAEIRPKKPEKFTEMVRLAEILSKDIPHLRVDFYYTNNKIYFGELTFFDGSGFDKIEPIGWDYKLGSWIKLPDKIIKGV